MLEDILWKVIFVIHFMNDMEAKIADILKKTIILINFRWIGKDLNSLTGNKFLE